MLTVSLISQQLNIHLVNLIRIVTKLFDFFVINFAKTKFFYKSFNSLKTIHLFIIIFFSFIVVEKITSRSVELVKYESDY